jgi:hypothetical protein
MPGHDTSSFLRAPGFAGFTLREISCDRTPPAWRFGDATPHGGAYLSGDLG